MTDYYVNGNQTGLIFDKLSSTTTVTMTGPPSPSNIITGAPAGLVTGDTVQIQERGSPVTFNTYEIVSTFPTRIHENWQQPSGGYIIRYGHGNGQSETNAFPTIFTALANASGNDNVFVKHIDGGYVLSRAEQSQRALDVGTGTLSTNRQLLVEGYKEVIGDMSFGGEHYQSPFSAYILGIDTTKKIIIDGNSALSNLIDISSSNNVLIKNLLFKESTDVAIGRASAIVGVSFRGCFFQDIFKVINATTDDMGITFDSCLIRDINSVSGNLFKFSGSEHRVSNCIIYDAGSVLQLFNVGDNTGGNGCLIANNLIIGGKYGVRLQGSSIIVNNTFYNSLTCVNVQGNNDFPSLDLYNNILIPKVHDSGYALAINADDTGGAAGSTIYNDFNCILAADGQEMDTAFYNGFAGGTEPVLGRNSIEVDPLFVDASGGDFRLQQASPCINTADRDAQDGFNTMGCFMRENKLVKNGWSGNSGWNSSFKK